MTALFAQPIVVSGTGSTFPQQDLHLRTLIPSKLKFDWSEPHIHNEEILSALRHINFMRGDSTITSSVATAADSLVKRAIDLSCIIKDQAITDNPQHGLPSGNRHHMISLAGLMTSLEDLFLSSEDLTLTERQVVIAILAPHTASGRANTTELIATFHREFPEMSSKGDFEQHWKDFETVITPGNNDLRPALARMSRMEKMLALGTISSLVMTAHRLPSDEQEALMHHLDMALPMMEIRSRAFEKITNRREVLERHR